MVNGGRGGGADGDEVGEATGYEGARAAKPSAAEDLHPSPTGSSRALDRLAARLVARTTQPGRSRQGRPRFTNTEGAHGHAPNQTTHPGVDGARREPATGHGG